MRVFLTLLPVPSSSNQALLAITNWLNWFLNGSQFLLFPGVKDNEMAGTDNSDQLVEEIHIMESILMDSSLCFRKKMSLKMWQSCPMRCFHVLALLRSAIGIVSMCFVQTLKNNISLRLQLLLANTWLFSADEVAVADDRMSRFELCKCNRITLDYHFVC